MAKSSSVALLMEHGFKVVELARLLSCDRSTIWRWRQRKQPPPRAELVFTLLLDRVKQVGARSALRSFRRHGVLLRLQPCKKPACA